MPVSWWATFNLVINGYPSPKTGEWVGIPDILAKIAVPYAGPARINRILKLVRPGCRPRLRLVIHRNPLKLRIGKSRQRRVGLPTAVFARVARRITGASGMNAVRFRRNVGDDAVCILDLAEKKIGDQVDIVVPRVDRPFANVIRVNAVSMANKAVIVKSRP